MQYWSLLTIACDESIPCTETEWLFMARQWCTAFEEQYVSESVTTCIHAFVCTYHSLVCANTTTKVYHVGYWKQKHGSIERFGNYAVETTHSSNKRVIRTATGQLSHLDRDNNVCTQILARNHRLQEFNEKLGPQEARPHGKARWLDECFEVVVEPKAKFDWAQFAVEYPPTETNSEPRPDGMVGVVAENSGTAVPEGDRLDSTSLEDALNSALMEAL